ncbi:SDR family NAD(P)-dependent oxidoreductase [Pseudoroseicyclus tamaricis]|uniref:SDR family NAD(P)-dependent oxidoreductase n=1 Tax=Pseudoroseicyclus tamaricis TaxID=2705421 RepID=A0A6B2K1F3_9RHOB|nr:SDR family NAD(P)-dependent oxidoreductase [Pseudoroseicyclus tamaricis]NDV02809.1 SDR family NAD(P)-dependent oxidoreductase [Pseudoroseicyclus tamaricis]
MSRRIIITGASDGIGAAAARQLVRDGHNVILVGRSPEKTKAVAEETGAPHHLADFARLDEVRRLADELKQYGPIDVLANNAGGVFQERRETVDGFEMTFQVNHLAPFLLTHLLLDRLMESNASVIQTSSVGNRAGKVDLGNLGFAKGYAPMRAYGTAKLENILFTQELHRRFHERGLSSAAFHPGVVASSFAGSSTDLMGKVYASRLARSFMRTNEQGADQLVWLASTPAGEGWESGQYYEKRKPARRINRQTRDAALARALWARSEQVLGLTPAA